MQKSLAAKLWKFWGVLAFVILMDAAVVFPQVSGQGTRPATVRTVSQLPQLYAADPAALTPVECGQCHTAAYLSLRDNGGRHRFECQQCHQKFHDYLPLQKNWDQLMPKCADCHAGPSHDSEVFNDCAACHLDPHEIVRPVRVTEKVSRSCAICHAPIVEQLQMHPSAHSKMPCLNCHSQEPHGFSPSCGNCHKPHYQGQPFASCAKECHPVHAPQEIIYQRDVAARTCGSCHGKVYATWQRTPSRHARVNCAVCHSSHGFIPDCRSCHAQPHSAKLLQKFPNCLLCHQNAHDLPVKRGSS